MSELTVWAQEVDETLTKLVETKAWTRMCPESYRPAVSKLVKTRAIPRYGEQQHSQFRDCKSSLWCC
jgi:hypothetical protein